jgi:hypothetical protein
MSYRLGLHLMRQTIRRSAAVAVCMLLCSMVALLVWHQPDAVRAEDRDGDGRSDLWRSFDRHGRTAVVALDTNFDGRSDVEEFYEAGALVRRQADRDFNDRIDLVQHFDPETQRPVRSLTDVNGDGIADLLVLFQEGEPVYTKWALSTGKASATVALRVGGDHGEPDSLLLPLDDPFSADLAITTTHALTNAPEFTPSAPVGMPEHPRDASTFAIAPRVSVADVSDLSAAHVSKFSPRAPPART